MLLPEEQVGITRRKVPMVHPLRELDKCGSGFEAERKQASAMLSSIIHSWIYLVLVPYRVRSQGSPHTAEGRQVSLEIALYYLSNFLTILGIDNAK